MITIVRKIEMAQPEPAASGPERYVECVTPRVSA